MTFVNPAAAKMLGYEPDEAQGKQLQEVYPMPNDRIPSIRDVVEEQNMLKLESVLCILREGEGRYMDIVIYLLSQEDYRGAVIRIDDVTERAIMEERLVQSRKMVSGLGIAVSYFLITVAHQGMMDVESAPGRAARFMIRLPPWIKTAESYAGVNTEIMQRGTSG